MSPVATASRCSNPAAGRSLIATSRRQGSRLKPDQVAAALAQDVVSRQAPAGSLLPTEAQLVERFGVSRSVVREALRGLAATGLVETRHGVGSIVNDERRWDVFDPQVLEAHVTTGSLPAIVGELVEVRRLVEVEAAALAAERASAAERRTLRHWLDRMEQLMDEPPAMAQADIAFHDIILEAAGNRFLHAVMEYLRPVLTRARVMTSELGGRAGRRRAQTAHAAVLERIEARDPAGAREAMREHVLVSEDDIRNAILRLGPEAPESAGTEA